MYKRDQFDNTSGQIMTDNFMPTNNPQSLISFEFTNIYLPNLVSTFYIGLSSGIGRERQRERERKRERRRKGLYDRHDLMNFAPLQISFKKKMCLTFHSCSIYSSMYVHIYACTLCTHQSSNKYIPIRKTNKTFKE